MNWTFRTHAVNKSMTALIPAGWAQEGCRGLLAADVLARLPPPAAQSALACFLVCSLLPQHSPLLSVGI